jgi:hypothetical protein
MRYILPLLMISLLAISIVCQKVSSTTINETAARTQPETTVQDDAPRISLADAKSDFDTGNAVFVDSRPEEFYKAEHIKGAINVSYTEVEKRYKIIPKDKKIIVYCS